MSLDEESLEQCVETGQIDYEKWPAIVNPLLDRLNYIAHNDFPTPRPYPIINPVLLSQRPSDADRFFEQPPTLPSQPVQAPSTPRTLPPVPPFPGSAATHIPDSQPPRDQSQEKNTTLHLPPELLQILNQALHTLRSSFAQKPPHTVQRLSELVLHPNRHYRTLPAWLRALDRVVSVSSSADVFPLSDVPPHLNGILNGSDAGGILFANSSSNDTRNGYDRDALGSDESLGGALLTPILWLKDSDLSSGTTTSTEMDANSKVEAWEGPSGDGDMEEMLGESIAIEQPPTDDDANTNTTASAVADAQAIASVAQENLNEGSIPQREGGAVTQGELIRMEQEAGVVPRQDKTRVGDMGIDMTDQEEEMPHASGPDIVGTVDMGLVGGQEREIRISSPPPERSRRQIDANDAQEVLEGGTTKNKGTGNGPGSSGGDSDEYVDVGKEAEMQIEKPEGMGSASNEGQASDDGDIVLVDADGATEDAEQGEKADESGVNVGADAADSAVQ